MIAHINGEVVEKILGSLIIDVNNIGYEIQVPQGEYESLILGDRIKLYTYHHIREQSEELFGFTSLAGKKLFELLITVQGVGPKAAISILSLGNSEAVRNAIANTDKDFIARASGVGKKTAERVVVDLSDKVGLALRRDNDAIGNSQLISSSDEAHEALMALGYSLGDASIMLEGISTDLSTSERVKKALQQ